MTKRARVVFVVCFLVTVVSPLQASWLNRKAEGWAWYEDKEIIKDKEEVKEEKAEEHSAVQRMTKMKKKLEEKLSLAVLEPTQKNVRSYITMQKEVLEQSTLFSKEWMKVILNTPSLDYTVNRPTSHYGNQVHKQVLLEKRTSFLRAVAQEYGLFFFYKGACKYSQAFAGIVQEFSRRYGWNVIPVSIDGIILKEFPETRQDEGISEKFQVSNVPALFAVNPRSNEIIPIAYGLFPLDKLEENTLVQFLGEKELEEVSYE
jgi:conjugal transfer pilus assembly protein TraF